MRKHDFLETVLKKLVGFRVKLETDILESFGLNNMISDTLEQMTAMGRFYCFNNVYIPEGSNMDKRKRVVVSA